MSVGSPWCFQTSLANVTARSAAVFPSFLRGIKCAIFVKRSMTTHQEKKSASGRTGCVQTHQVLGTLWTHPVSAHTTPNAKRTGNVNSDAARHGTVCPDADRHGICLLDRAWQGIFLLDALCQGIFLLDAAVSGHFPSGHSCIRAFSSWMRRVMAAWSRWLSRHGTSQQILGLHLQTRSGFQA